MRLRTLARVGLVAAALFAYLSVGLSSAVAATCESLAALTLPNTRVLSAQAQPAGRFTPQGAGPGAGNPAPNPALENLPAFCRVTASLHPTTDSDIRIEVWLPAAGWNGKLQSVGNGAWAGTIGYPALGTALSSGYTTAATDTGHVGNTAKFAPGHPEKMVDYGHRAVHEMTVAAKAMISAFYGNGPRVSYWNGCSTGGRQGLMEALRYPADYDGIIAGAPVNFRTHQLTWELWVAQAVHRDEASYYTNIVSTVGRETAGRSVRLFMMPGMNHCGGGEGPNTFNRMKVIEQWVEQRQPPTRIEASHATSGIVDRTRPLCPYPEVARYTGTGSIDEAANFACRRP